MTFKVLITDGLESVGLDLINQAGEAVDRKGIEPAELLAEVGEYHGMIVRGRTKVTREVFEAAKNLKVVGLLVSVSIISIRSRQRPRCDRCQLPHRDFSSCRRTRRRYALALAANCLAQMPQ